MPPTVEVAAPAGRTTLSIERMAFPVAYAVVAMLCIAEFFVTLSINNGHFVYTLDDPYIHLALSDQLRHGHYGLFPGVASAPSSSILYPWVLASAAGTALHPFLPLLLNLGALFGTLVLIRCFLRDLRLGEERFVVVTEAAALVMVALCCNLIGVVFSGLEHSVHIFLVTATLVLLARRLDGAPLSPWLLAAIVVSPLVRYEGLGLSLAALLTLWLLGHRREALVSFAVIAGLVGGFSRYLTSLGLSPLPSSVMVKSSAASHSVGNGGLARAGESLAMNAMGMHGHPVGLLLMLVAVVCVARCALAGWSPSRWSGREHLALVLALTLLAHAAAGRFGWFERYELYAVLTALLGMAYVAQDALRGVFADRRRRAVLVAAFFVAMAVMGDRYAAATELVPLASNDVYQQQYQMRRFLCDYYRAPAAVNDLGLASYGNPKFVLDLGGLGSEEARHMLARAAGPEDYERFLRQHDVHLAVIYRGWFGARIPRSWISVATLRLSRQRVSVSEEEVEFFATDEPTAKLVRGEMAEFRAGLPDGVRLTVR